MYKSTRVVLAILAAFTGASIALSGMSAATTTKATPTVVGATHALIPPGCAVAANLGATADDYISQCRLASVRRVFPSQYLFATLAQIKVDRTTAGRTAWKLLTNGEYAKP